jgi:hypothetical protein
MHFLTWQRLGKSMPLEAEPTHLRRADIKEKNTMTIITLHAPEPRPPQDADGCYHVFIDVGANIGVHA